MSNKVAVQNELKFYKLYGLFACLFEQSKKASHANQSSDAGRCHRTSIGIADRVVELVQLAFSGIDTIFNSPAVVGVGLFALVDNADLDIV